MASIIQVGTAAMGGAQSQAFLNQAFVMANLGMFRFRQFAEPGVHPRGNGLVSSMPQWSDFAATGSAIAETATVPIGTATVSTSTIAVAEVSHSVNYSQLSAYTLNVSPESICKKLLARDALKAFENLAETAFDACLYRYVGTATGGYAVTTNGTATATNTSALNAYHVGAIRDYMVGTLKLAPWDAAGNFVGIVTVKAGRQVKDDSTFESWKLYADPGALLSGEVGRLEGIRFVEATEASGFDATIGSGNITGEAYFFGDEPIRENLCVPEHIRVDSSDFDRILCLAYYAVTGFGTYISGVVKWTSA